MFKVFGEHDEKTLNQMRLCMESGSAVAGVLCADGHLGYGHPIGGVVGYSEHISVSGVGFDIACGNMAVKLDAKYTDIKDRTMTILQDISKVVSFGVGRKNETPVDHELFDSMLWTDAGTLDLKDKARAQLGTVGSGNHYVDMFRDDDDNVWIGVHFGSRGLGHTITTRILKEIGAKDDMTSPPALIEANSDLGLTYRYGIELAGMYAYAGREWVVETVRKIIGGNVLDMVHNHHNFLWEEEHGGERLHVVRKGATPAFPGQRGFVGGSMCEDAVIVSGVESPEAMYSTVHGAGRVMSRTNARRSVDRTEWNQWLQSAGVTLIGADLDEAPQAYRRLSEVLGHHEGTIDVVKHLKPFGVIMAGRGDFDPYKD